MVQSAKNSLLITFCRAQGLSPVTKHRETVSGGKRMNLETGDQNRMGLLEDLSSNRLGVGDGQARERHRSGRVVF